MQVSHVDKNMVEQSSTVPSPSSHSLLDLTGTRTGTWPRACQLLNNLNAFGERFSKQIVDGVLFMYCPLTVGQTEPAQALLKILTPFLSRNINLLSRA